MPATAPSPEQIAAFAARDQDAPVAMINLLKFKDKATYPDDKPEAAEGLTGAEAYARYGAEVQKIFGSIGAKPLFAGAAPAMMIGEGDWDMTAIVLYPSRTAMITMTTSAEYQAIHYHRDAGLDHQVLIDTTSLLPQPE